MKVSRLTRLELLLYLVIIFQGGSAMAGIIAFENPDPGEEGHFNWRLHGRNEDPTFESWLNITRPSTEQFELQTGDSVGQLFAFNGGDSQNFTMDGASVATFDGFGGLSRAFTGGEVISADADFETFTVHALIADVELVSNFPEGELRYFGVQTQNGNFGWIGAIRSGLEFRATGWAYETEPGVPINAGQVPVGGTAPILGLGLLFRRSRKRKR